MKIIAADQGKELLFMFDCLFFVCKYSMFQGEPDQIFDLIKKLILKDPQKRLTAVQTLDVAQKQLAQMYVYYLTYLFLH